MSNGPYPDGTQFQPEDPEAMVYDSLTDLLSDGFGNTVWVGVWFPTNGDSIPSARLSITDLREQYDNWTSQQLRRAVGELIAKAQVNDVQELREAGALTVEWGWRTRSHPDKVHVVETEQLAREMVAAAPDLFDIVARLVTEWSTEGAE
jgi:hypothetical protein